MQATIAIDFLTEFDLNPQFLRDCAVSKMALQTGLMWFAGKVKK
jgi:hypothetical protein